MDIKQPKLCPALEHFREYFGPNSSCKNWPYNFIDNITKPKSDLIEEMFKYGKENLALIHVVIQSPYVTKIKRDVAMTRTHFFANTGGLFGLCLGFSLISCIEILFWFCCCCKEFKKNVTYFDSSV